MSAVVPRVERVHTPKAASERAMLVGFLDHHRSTLLWKCEGLAAEQLKQRAVPPSRLSLLGLVRHLTDVERGWFRGGLGGETRATAGPLYYTADNEDGDIDDVDDADAEADVAAYRSEIEVCNESNACTRHADLLREAIDGATGE